MAKNRDKARSEADPKQDALSETPESSEELEASAPEAPQVDVAALQAALEAERNARLAAENNEQAMRKQVEALKSSPDARPAPVLSTESFLLHEPPADAKPDAIEDRPKRMAPKDAFGPLRYIIKDLRNLNTPRQVLHWTIPAGNALSDRYDSYEIVFQGGQARVPAVVGEWYREWLNHRFEVVAL